MGLRITTWNVNGIRNPFGYQPWRDRRTFEAMFDILEADIVVMQETKIQRKDLRDDMVLISGWDVYFSLPKHKKGYSGVAIFTRNAVCAPVRAEEGITGVLCAPNSTTSFRDLPEDQRIGGYPTDVQLSQVSLDAATIDCEGRCVILEFPAFVLIGVYCPANRDETRDEFRLGFLNLLEARVRNLVSEGKRVILTGDLNIIREEIDTANAEEQLRKQGLTGADYVSTPARRIFNQLIVDGKVIGDRDVGRERPVLCDICRVFQPGRRGMYTCWEQKINARPGNFGSRIDYVLCSQDCREWFCDSNIQEGLMGSDHCPVYAVISDNVRLGVEMVNIKDIMNPPGVFAKGMRKSEWSTKFLLPMSAKLIPEFDRRRSIRDMFSTKPAVKPELPSKSTVVDESDDSQMISDTLSDESDRIPLSEAQPTSTLLTTDTIITPSKDVSNPTKDSNGSSMTTSSKTLTKPQSNKRATETASTPGNKKRARTFADSKDRIEKGQRSLKGFFKPKASTSTLSIPNTSNGIDFARLATKCSVGSGSPNRKMDDTHNPPGDVSNEKLGGYGTAEIVLSSKSLESNDNDTIIDPIVAKESWSKLLGKRTVPRCEHNEPCVSYLTKKPGINCGRSFFMCPRPLGPSGAKEKGTQWRCGTFIWSSDWTENEK